LELRRRLSCLACQKQIWTKFHYARQRWRERISFENSFAMSNSNPDNPANPSGEKSSGEQAHDALVARLARLESNLIPVRPPKSLQPTPEAAKTRLSRLRKKRLLIQGSKRPLPSQSTIPPARDPLAP
jgi:hypothetical protein